MSFRLPLLFFPLLAGILPAASITSGALDIWSSSDYSYGTLSVDGPGLHLQDYFQSPPGPFPISLSVGLCYGVCSFNFSGTLTPSAFQSSLTFNGVSYQPDNYFVWYSLLFVGTPITATAICDYVAGHPPTCNTAWPSEAFSLTGTISVVDKNSGKVVIAQDVSGQGFTTASSYNEAPGPWNYGHTTYTFTPTPEPATGLAMGFAMLVFGSSLIFRKRHAR